MKELSTGVDDSPGTIVHLKEAFRRQGLARPMRLRRYDAGDVLTYDITGVAPARAARVRLAVEKFVGGGFAGQVYRARLVELAAPHGELPGLEVGREYAVKIFLPASSFARRFRNALYAVGFQAPFQIQVNPAAARAGALWQMLIRRGAALRFGTEGAVKAIYATFVDRQLGSCGEISEWIVGRLWRFEVNDRLWPAGGGSWAARETTSARRSTCPRRNSWPASWPCCTRWAPRNSPASTNGGR